jgi:hypothetical protein
MKHGRDADAGTEVLWIGGDLDDRVRAARISRL